MRSLFLLLLSICCCRAAAPWEGIIDSARAVDWSTMDIGANITNRTSTNQSLTSTATAADINSAISACADNAVVYLAAGTYTLNNGLSLKRNITLRGAGANLTKLRFSAGTGCSFGDADSAVCVQGASGSTCFLPNGPTAVNWTAGYTPGTTTITLAGTTGIALGDLIYLDQNDEASDGYPATGDTVFASDGGFSYQGGDTFKRPNKGQLFISVVTAISGSDITIRHPLIGQTWRSGQDPEAYWCTAGASITNVGIENLSMDFTGIGNTFGVMFYDAYDCWITGCRIIMTNVANPSSPFCYVRMIQTCNITVKNNYLWGPEDGDGDSGINHYGIVFGADSHTLVENNIIYNNPGQIEVNGVTVGSVISYNIGRLTWYNSFADHDKGAQFYLLEGNDITGFTGDVTHGTGNFGTLFRNRLEGANTGVTGDTVIWLMPYRRFYNLIGNVLGNANNVGYESSAVNNNFGDVVFYMGGSDTTTTLGMSHSIPSTDSRVKDTLLRWGNWDYVSNVVSWNNNEVPSTITSFSNSIPASQTLPNSFYQASKPEFWGTTYGTPAWPPIGPDVVNGDIANLDGLAYKIPARLVYENMPVDSEYTTQGIGVFNATNYFEAAEGGPVTGTIPAKIKGVRLRQQ